MIQRLPETQRRYEESVQKARADLRKRQLLEQLKQNPRLQQLKQNPRIMERERSDIERQLQRSRPSFPSGQDMLKKQKDILQELLSQDYQSRTGGVERVRAQSPWDDIPYPWDNLRRPWDNLRFLQRTLTGRDDVRPPLGRQR